MHDIRLIRDDPAAFDAAMGRRGLTGIADRILSLDEARRAAIHEAESAKARQNAASREAGAAKAAGDDAAFARLRAEVADSKTRMADREAQARDLDAQQSRLLLELPNVLAPDVPDGRDEADNIEVKRWGTPRDFDFAPQEHYQIPAVAADLDFATAARLSGSRFVVLRGTVARLHRALAQFMLDIHTTEHGMTEINAPVIVRDDAMYGTNQLPKFAEDSFRLTDGRWLIPTSEVTLTNTVRETVLDADALPLRMTAHSLCFRSEAGSAGKDTAGMLRQHQFEKVEMVAITRPEDSEDEQLRMLRCAETVLERLDLPYRTVKLCSGDTGFGARRTFDIEAWLPGQRTYREISSVSTTGDFQARRMNARFRSADDPRPRFVHTLNGSGLAVGRTLIAVLENGQQGDGSVVLPPALAPYLAGMTRIAA
ncbi:seryl-tRNA synthetase SerS [Oceaniovalibus guishaninsula JLT2003]|uniref:Serine--tRNA ligase n=1 Tax=Oceaniovalibus guishaninsula JLT2003 TaxID=1231392 RepID=K2GLA4_9RHOB|nr:serine--tRNA ligase [Oceaniovalibus guishaninsula]EKE43541.1 seryl-tRNA synthetase SerS [Oceaniovalibus guishaninsula JLT2003]